MYDHERIKAISGEEKNGTWGRPLLRSPDVVNLSLESEEMVVGSKGERSEKCISACTKVQKALFQLLEELEHLKRGQVRRDGAHDRYLALWNERSVGADNGD